MNTAELRKHHERKLFWLGIIDQATKMRNYHLKEHNYFFGKGLTGMVDHYKDHSERMLKIKVFAIKRYEIC